MSDQRNDLKHFATLQARAALCGWALERVDDGYVIARWGRCRAFDSLAAVEAFIRRVEGQRHG